MRPCSMQVGEPSEWMHQDWCCSAWWVPCQKHRASWHEGQRHWTAPAPPSDLPQSHQCTATYTNQNFKRYTSLNCWICKCFYTSTTTKELSKEQEIYHFYLTYCCSKCPCSNINVEDDTEGIKHHFYKFSKSV